MKPEKIGKIQFETTPLKRNVFSGFLGLGSFFFLNRFLLFPSFDILHELARQEVKVVQRRKRRRRCQFSIAFPSLRSVTFARRNKTNKKQTKNKRSSHQSRKVKLGTKKKLSFRSGVNVPPKTAALVMDRDVPFTSCSRSVSSQ